MLAFLSSPVKLVSLALIVGGVVLKFFANTLVSLLGDFGAVTDVTKLDLGIPEMADVKELPFLDDVGLFFIIFGCILFVISFCACCGACYQWRPLLIVVRTRSRTVTVLAAMLLYTEKHAQDVHRCSVRDHGHFDSGRDPGWLLCSSL